MKSPRRTVASLAAGSMPSTASDAAHRSQYSAGAECSLGRTVAVQPTQARAAQRLR